MGEDDSDYIAEKMTDEPPVIHQESGSTPDGLIDLTVASKTAAESVHWPAKESSNALPTAVQGSKSKSDQALAEIIQALDEDTPEEFGEMLTLAFADSPQHDESASPQK